MSAQTSSSLICRSCWPPAGQGQLGDRAGAGAESAGGGHRGLAGWRIAIRSSSGTASPRNWGGMSLATRQRGTLTAVALALVRHSAGLFRPDAGAAGHGAIIRGNGAVRPLAAGRALLRALHAPASGCESAVLAFALLALAAPAAVLLIR